MKKYHIPQPQRIRNIKGSFAWIDHRIMRNGFMETMTHQDIALYLFLILVADTNGVSFYRKEKICQAVSLDFSRFEIAKDRLINMKLIAFESYSVLSPIYCVQNLFAMISMVSLKSSIASNRQAGQSQY